MKSTTSHELMLELRMSGGTPLLPVHDLLARAGTTFNSLQLYQLIAQIYMYITIYLPHSFYMFGVLNTIFREGHSYF